MLRTANVAVTLLFVLGEKQWMKCDETMDDMRGTVIDLNKRTN